MKLSLYLDEDAMARSLVAGLRARGADVQTVIDAGLGGKEDKVKLLQGKGVVTLYDVASLLL